MKQLLGLTLSAVLAGCAAHARVGPAFQQEGRFERVTLAWDASPPSSTPGAPSAKPWMSLTASDGTGLEMVSYRARAVADGPLAFTELHLAFHNRQDRVIEGTFRVALPPTASVSRFAMKIGDRLQEGEVVELDTARRSYESFMHRRVDPALLEQSRANEFRARVFPIPAGATKELVLSYSEELTGARAPYELRLRGLPHLDALDVEVLLPASRRVVELSKRDVVPDRDLLLPDAGGDGSVALRRGRLAVARVAPAAASSPEPIANVLVLFDTSASRAPDLDREIARLGELVAALRRAAGDALAIRVACFDQEVVEVYAGPASGFGPADLARIAARGALGASDLESALRWARQRAPGRVLVVTDGVATAGSTTPGALLDEVTRVSASARVDALITGGVRDPAVAEQLAGAGPGRRGVVADFAAPPGEIVTSLAGAARSVTVRVPGSVWSFPTEIPPGRDALVYAELPEGASLTVDTGAGPTPVRALDAPAPLLERAVAGARIAELSRRREGLRDEPARIALRQEMVGLSTRHRVLTPFTGFLVLETEADYARFRLDRSALNDILAVGPEGVELQKHPDPITGPGRDGAPQGAPIAPSLSDGDADRDGIWDQDDACPREPGPPHPDPARHGCPQLIRIMSNEIRVLTMVQFAPGAATILPASHPLLEEVAQVLKHNPQIKKIAIEGHSDNHGPRALNVRITEARANAVRAHLIRLGVAPDRLVTKGWGPDRPIADNRTPEGRAKNRRVSFLIVGQALDEAPARRLPMGKPPFTARATSPHTGRLGAVHALLRDRKHAEALREARAWYRESPSDVLAVVALGEALEAAGQPAEAARAYGSLIDLHPGQADMRRYAGALLESLSPRAPGALALATQSYRRALADRRDHPASHRRLGYALLRAGEPEQAFEVFAAARRAAFAAGRFPAIEVVLRDDLSLAAAAWTRAAPERRDAIAARAGAENATVRDRPSMHVSLSWETDASDLDLRVLDAKGDDASHRKTLLTGGRVYADVTEGYGPEVLVVEGEPRAFPYRVEVQSYRQGPTGHGLGSVEIVRHDGRGGLTFEVRPFVIMEEGTVVDLGTIERGKPG